MFAHAMSEHDAGDAQEEEERRARLLVHRALPALTRLDLELLGAEACERRLAHPVLKWSLHVLDDAVVERVGLLPGPLDRHARLQAREDIRPVALAVVELAVEPRLHGRAHGERHEHVRLGAHGRATEALGSHADHGHRVPVHDHRAVEHVRVGPEVVLPVLVGEHDHRMLPDVLVVGDAEQTPQRRLHAQDREVGPRDEHPRRVQRVALEGQVGAEQPVRRDAGERQVRLLQVAEHRVAEDLVAVARLVARLGAGLRPRRPQVDEPIGILHRQLLEQDLVEQREDGGVRPDPERERQHGHGGDERRLGERARGELQVGHRGPLPQ